MEESSTDLESIVSNDNRPAPSGADRAVDPAAAGSVVGGSDGGARSMSDGGRSVENDDQPVDNNDVRRSFRREIGRPIFDNSRPVITGKKITNRTWKKRKKMTYLSFSERAIRGTIVTINRAKHYAFIRRRGKMMKI